MKILFTMILLVTALASHAKILHYKAPESVGEVSSESIQRISEQMEQRLRTQQGWTVVLDSQSEKEQADATLVAVISLESDGSYAIRASLIEGVNGKELQSESENLGNDLDTGLGKIAAFAKLFDPSTISSRVADAPSKTEKDTSTVVNWVLTIGAGLVALAVLWTVLN